MNCGQPIVNGVLFEMPNGKFGCESCFAAWTIRQEENRENRDDQGTPRCYTCKHKRGVPGNAHVRCDKPDPLIKGHPRGVAMGWFMYPYLFDPVWVANDCRNYEAMSTLG